MREEMTDLTVTVGDDHTNDLTTIRLLDRPEVELVQCQGGDRAIANAARVSTLGQHIASAVDEAAPGINAGLIRFLMRNRHGTPFEHTFFTFRVHAPIFVMREFQRHRAGWSYNEESGRYRELEPVFYTPGTERDLVQVGRAGQYRFEPGDEAQRTTVAHSLLDSYLTAWKAYQEMLAAGVAREVARLCLPVATYSSMYASCNARSLMHFLSLRTRREGSAFPSYPQREIELVAEAMEAEFQRVLPATAAAFNEFGRVAP